MQDDSLLVRQALAGDKLAFNHLVQKYWKLIYAQVLFTVGNPDGAEELTNDAFVEAYLDLSHLRQFSSFRSWLRQRKEPCLSLDEVADETEARFPQDSVEDQLLQQEKFHRALEAIDRLPEIDRALMHDFYFEGLPYKALQKRYHLSKAAVKMRLFRARRKVRGLVLGKRSM